MAQPGRDLESAVSRVQLEFFNQQPRKNDMKTNPAKSFNKPAIVATLLAALCLTATSVHAFTTLAGWDVSGLTGGGTTTLAPATVGTGVIVSNLVRGAGIGQGTATTSFGGNHWTNSTDSLAISSNCVITCVITPATNYTISFNAVDKLNYNRSGTGPANGELQYSLDGVNFTTVQTFSWSTTSGNGVTVNADLSGFSDLQNVGYGTNITFRIVNWGATGATGTWYIKDAATAGNDYEFLGTATQIQTGTPPGNVAITPASVVTNATATVNLTVTSTGDSPTSYAWYQEPFGVSNVLASTNLISTSGPTLTLANATAANSGNYQVVIANGAGSGTSSVATVSIMDPAIVAQPLSLTNVLNDVDFFGATVVSSQPGLLLWYYNGSVISNVVATVGTNMTTIFTINNPAATNLSGYYLVASNQFGMSTSAVVTATIAVTPPAELTRWDFNATNNFTPTNPAPSLGAGTASALQNPAVTNFIFAPGALFDPNELVTDATNEAWELNGFSAGISNKTAGFEYHVDTTGYGNIMLTWSERHSATASKYMRVQYTTNGTDYLDGDVIVFSQVLYQFYSSDLSTKPGVANNPNFGFRVVAEFESTATGDSVASYTGTSSAFSSAGTIREDLMTVFGSVLGTGPIPLNANFSGNNVTFTWSDPSFLLQSAPAVTGPWTTIPGAGTGYQTSIVKTQNMFFRLMKP
jgi:Immunoglobulin I-set domain